MLQLLTPVKQRQLVEAHGWAKFWKGREMLV